MTSIRLVAAGRVAVGLVACVARAPFLQWLFGESSRGSASRALARMAGARDVAIGVATLAAVRNGGIDARRLAALGALCDAADASIALIPPGLAGRARRLNVTAGALAAAAGLIAVWQTPRSRPDSVSPGWSPRTIAHRTEASRPVGGESPAEAADEAAGDGFAQLALSDDTMNTIVDRHRDGSWCVWTVTADGRRVVSRHTTRELAEQAALRLAARPDQALDAGTS